ncbi:MAG: RNA polymerase sigma factor [Armatimonadota bacterium]|nr:RNA polymerase sigma factor [Armatimonadota bacterium]
MSIYTYFSAWANKTFVFCHYADEDARLTWGKQKRREEAADITALYAEHGDRIFRFCFRLCGRMAEAEDLTQEVFLAAFQSAGRFEGRSSVTTWLYRIALNCGRNARRSRRLETVPLEDAPASGPSLEQTVTDDLVLSCALAALPDDLREAFLLVKAEGLTYREAAHVLNAPQGTIQWRVHEAIQKLRALLKDQDHDNL